ncbi:bifunctional glutamate--cysteine ligase GshA/glutathione synthetase GshB [Streptococcus constellatus subsp. pharyngis]|uniref:Glutathione biosynthesis bifunctional protein GshAB n=2 Tax=Streptococcus constellatus subsp. pharyngis SK1060 = CCUG 46377 TaxID=1035184 RepID=U2YA07_STRCV|nr:bifunctional glutamate--cysteine ligase GshA/glutathione synthetase GshB [Streptococcus constellatus]AGU72023.1 glutamate-cysteine ligase [Streptococcus constellatus subsp. pharyngis C232]AGU73779.1 glutamate-cysteine ligase [Streptococcus constellatus subsp. pharyngis C818]AGU79147.1 glutamate-cysteine ligase [Streptococcus constellatus subsp. pharyngis C1050]QQC22291.1 bifunctional glutamate--cysteine ligase GshA/glutathione synthetase GshB [Streptococcus constellatus]QRP81408.1 bifunctio
MNINHLLEKIAVDAPILQATFGLEREGLRVNQNGKLAQTSHPKAFGSRNFHPTIQTDFSEQQLELITPIAPSTKEARRFLAAITDVAGRTIPKNEVIWPLSMPPKLSPAEIQIAHLENDFERYYREGLAKKYGKTLQAISGIHYNMELGPDLIQALFKVSDYKNIRLFKNDLYLKLARNFLRFRWFLTYLYGAAPIAEEGFLTREISQPVRSIRNSDLGYVNDQKIHISYASLESYVSDIEKYVAQGDLIAEKECYMPVRFRGQKENRLYLEKGITYLEFRCFDLNPFEVLGISQETMDTVHLFLLALLWLDDIAEPDELLNQAHALNEQIALSHPLTPLPVEADSELLLRAMQAVIHQFGLSSYYQDLFHHVKNAVADPSLTLSAQLLPYIYNQSLEAFGLEKAKAYHNYAWTASYALKGYENMELSTQMLLFDAIQKGVQVEILDESDQFLKLQHKNHIEYVKNGNMTSKDNYIVPLAMANKTVTKKILSAAGFPVPAGAEFSTLEEGIAYYSFIKDKSIVIKPKSTNFGLGISIFQEPTNLDSYQKALEIAFSEDSSILVEEFIAGTEYRFFVLDGKCEAVLLRLPANVKGDGRHTIRELVATKNTNPLRGRGHRSPLERIKLGEIELLMLEQQGYKADDILPKGGQVFLRRNSNISTGGDSIDMTEAMHPSYKKLAAEMATAIGAWVCGVDLIIPDSTLPASKKEPNCTCIELNFNPSMYMHTYCAEEPGQSITPHILAKLFPEIY